MNDAFKYIYNKFIPHGSSWYPFITNYYLTYQCNFKCSYCSDGFGNPYYTHANEIPLEIEKAKLLMQKISKLTNYAMITGGEPLLYNGFDKFISFVGKLKFKNLILTTNAFYLDQYIDLIINSFDTIIISLDTLDEAKSDSYWGYGNGAFKKVISNIELAASKCKGKRANILLSSVITPDNINDQYAVFEYAQNIGAYYTGNPQLVGVIPHKDLIDNENYIKLFDFLIQEKQKGANVFGYNRYLKELKDLNTFKCYPFSMLGIAPNGDIYYPCYEIGDRCANIFEINSLKDARNKGKFKFGNDFKCDPKCHSVCSLLFSLLLK